MLSIYTAWRITPSTTSHLSRLFIHFCLLLVSNFLRSPPFIVPKIPSLPPISLLLLFLLQTVSVFYFLFSSTSRLLNARKSNSNWILNRVGILGSFARRKLIGLIYRPVVSFDIRFVAGLFLSDLWLSFNVQTRKMPKKKSILDSKIIFIFVKTSLFFNFLIKMKIRI